MGQVVLSGQMIAGPPAAGDSFPGSQLNVPLQFISGGQAGKGYGVATGVLTRLVQSPLAFVPLQGVGPTDTVTKGDTLYFKCDSPMDLRVTQDDGVGGTTIHLEPGVHGVLLKEFSTIKPLVLLEVQGTGKMEYYISGPR